jgi:hypothetical protein
VPDSALALDLLGGLFGVLDPLTRVYKYLEGVKETREVKQRLSGTLVSLRLFQESSRASHVSGKALADRLEKLEPPMNSIEALELMESLSRFFEDYKGVFHSLRMFGKECRALNSGDLVAFMEKVKRSMPDVYDMMNFFGRNYDLKTDTLDLTNLPTVLRAWGPKGMWKESKDLSKAVEEGRKFAEMVTEKIRKIRGQRIVIRDRRPVLTLVRSLDGLAREAKRLKATPATSRELRQQAPSWFIGVASIVDDVRKALPGGSRAALR